MSNQSRGGNGQFEPKVHNQEILKAFDFEDDAMLTVTEVTDALSVHFGVDVSTEAVRLRLNEMVEDGLVERKEFGANAVGYQATVAPRLSEEVATAVEEIGSYEEQEETTSMDELRDELGLE